MWLGPARCRWCRWCGSRRPRWCRSPTIPKGLLTSCRRLLDRRRDCGPLVWLAARMLAAMDPRSEAISVMEALDADTTGRALEDGMHTLRSGSSVLAAGELGAFAAALHDRPDLRSLKPHDPEAAGPVDLVLMTSDCVGPSQALVAAETVPVAEAAQRRGTPVWLIAGAGRILPGPMWDLLSARRRPDDPAMRGPGRPRPRPLRHTSGHSVGPANPHRGSPSI